LPFILSADTTLKTESSTLQRKLSPDITSDGSGNTSTETAAVEHSAAAMANGLDLDKLAYCVAVAETADCTTGIGVTKNNCFGIMTWPNGKRTGKWYENKQASYEDFKRIWMKSYKTFPTYSMAVKWTGNDKPQTWLNTVTQCYNK